MDYFQWLDNLEKNLTPKLCREYPVIISGGQVSTDKSLLPHHFRLNRRRNLKKHGDMAISDPGLD